MDGVPKKGGRSCFREAIPVNEGDIKNLPAFLTVEETAKILRLKRSTAYEYIRQGAIPSVRLGHFIRVPKARILELAGLNGQQEDVRKAGNT